ncbi:MAG: hypothetical protein NT116_02510 [Candidatus Parcubacteria bacterium]|nr:hypothetical protein [Candidatus Parcubacteria bacterium]
MQEKTVHNSKPSCHSEQSEESITSRILRKALNDTTTTGLVN